MTAPVSPAPGTGFPGTALTRALPLGFAGSVAVVLLLMLASVAAFGFGLAYWRVADQDLVLAYQGILFADGLGQEYFDHTGYLAYLLTGAWYDLLHGLGLLPVHALSELPPAPEVPAYEAAWSGLVDAGRGLSLTLAAILVSAFALLLRRLTGDWRIAVVGALLFAFSGGLAFQMRIMRTELLAGGLTTLAALVLLIAAREPQLRLRPLLVGLAAFLAALAVVAKVQALVVVLALPVLALAWGARDRAGPGDRRLALLLAAPAIVAAGLAAWLLVTALASDGAIFTYTPMLPAFPGGYQAALAVWVVASVVLFARLYRAPAATTVATLLAMASGVSLALFTLLIRWHPQNTLALMFPAEHMFQFAAFLNPELAATGSGGLLGNLLAGFVEVLKVRTVVLEPSFRPTIVLEWYAIAAAVRLWLRGDRRTAVAVALSLLAIWGVDAVFTLRALNINYFIFTDGLVVVVAALAFVRLPEPSGRAVVAGAVVAIGMIAVSQIEPEKLRFDSARPDRSCPFFGYYTPRLSTFPYCAAAGFH